MRGEQDRRVATDVGQSNGLKPGLLSPLPKGAVERSDAFCVLDQVAQRGWLLTQSADQWFGIIAHGDCRL